MSKAVMQQALEALAGVAQWVEKRPDTHPWDAWQRIDPAITALKQALAEPEQEPVGTARELFTNAALEQLDIRPSTTVYLGAPTPRKPLTDWDIGNIYKKWNDTPGASMADFARAVIAAYKAKQGEQT